MGLVTSRHLSAVVMQKLLWQHIPFYLTAQLRRQVTESTCVDAV